MAAKLPLVVMQFLGLVSDGGFDGLDVAVDFWNVGRYCEVTKTGLGVMKSLKGRHKPRAHGMPVRRWIAAQPEVGLGLL
jgi:hypothetical protein